MRVVGKVLRVIAGIFCALMSFVMVLFLVVAPIGLGQVDHALTMVTGTSTTKVEGGDGTIYYASDYTSAEEQHNAAADLGEEILNEGMVLLRNEAGALPLAKGAKVSVFGQDAVDLLYGGAGAGSIDASAASTLKESLEASGFSVNPTLWDFYETGAGSAWRKTTPGVTGTGGFAVNEVPQSAYTEEVKASYDEYSDAALVVIGRIGSESTDLSQGYLEFTQEEKDELEYVRGRFDKVVVLLNTQNAMELGYLEEIGVDAVLWIGAPGQTGIEAVGKVLAGTTNPSGHLVDTYAYDVDSAPAVINQGDYTITNSTVESANKYISYSEGIYVGYRYYETRYEDAVLGQGNAGSYDYANEVQYAFGYGLSYTTFDWSGFSVVDAGDVYRVNVVVTNTGNVAGKDVVQVYLQKPYTDYDKANTIEKASVELAGFAKTKSLKPGESQTLQIDVEKEDLKTYDANGAGTYILEPGTYYLAAGTDAHAALNNILAAKGANAAVMSGTGNAAFVSAQEVAGSLDATTYASSRATGYAISNQFDDVDMRTYDSSFVYLSRSDWEGTWPELYANGSWAAPQNFLDELEITFETDESEQMPEFSTVNSEYGELTLASMIGLDYTDSKWDALISQMSKTELWDLVRKSGYISYGISSIGMPQITLKDGSAGISGTLTGGNVSCMGYAPEVVMASTYNLELIEEVGRMVGEDSINSGIAVWYAPSMNIHRSAYSGRNFEYYSEDPFLSGMMGVAECAGANSKGTITTIKHFAVNDQEQNRIGGSMLANEQSIRELYLKPFEMSIVDGGANAVMSSMNRIGGTWTGGHAGLITQVLHNEWGFKGFVTSDQSSFPSFNYCDIREGLEAGSDMWLSVTNFMWAYGDSELTATVMNQCRTAAHRILYTIANSNAMNGISADAKVVDTLPGWLPAVIAIYVLAILFTWVWIKLTHLCFGTRTLWQVIRHKPKKSGLRAKRIKAEDIPEQAAE